MNEQLKLKDDIEARNYFGELNFKEKTSRTLHRVKEASPAYFKSFFPIFSWATKYNRKWLLGDFIAGVTVGVMVVPQSLAYAKLANLPVVYGLYTGFMGVMLYSLMGTSREISVGPTAVLSLLVGSVVTRVLNHGSQFSAVDIAVALAFLGSMITFIMGIFRLGILLDLIPNPVIIGFTTGSAFTIILTQAAPLLGIPNVSSNDPTITIIYNFFTNIPNLNWRDLVFGLSSLAFILILDFISKRFSKKYPSIRFLKIASNGLAVLIFTIISFLVFNSNPKFTLKIVKEVPKGFNYIGVPNLNPQLLSDVALELIPVTLIGVLEHVALCKAFARQSSYQVSSSQELFALGICNFFASFFGAFPATGSFSRSAVKSQSGVRTPFAGIWTGTVVLMALGFLTPAFYYIPSATLSAIIIVSASSLVSSYKVVLDLWKVQPSDCLVFLLATLATFFAGAEIGIASSVGLAFLILVYQIARPHLYLLAQVVGRSGVFIDQKHPGYKTSSPLPGVLIFKPQESLIFPNIDYIRDSLLDVVLEVTRSGSVVVNPEDKLWCDDLEVRGNKLRAAREKQTGIAAPDPKSLTYLKAVIFDFSSVNLIDSSGLQGLFDIRDMLSRYAGVDDNKTIIEVNSKENIDQEFEIGGAAGENSASSSLNFNEDTKFFEMHFVSTNPQVLKVLELSGVTSPVAPILPRSFHNQTTEANIEPIVSNASRYVHLTVSDAVERMRISINSRIQS
ncbi:sulfate permease [Neoconidiobolus thromboides FSU 785]|nr:sulfate permease [Neoconidiobolus thromboides FSU 785]